MIQIRAGMPSASYQQHLKDQNATLLFDLVRRRSPISRAELTKASGLSAATVTVLVDELLQGGWLVELGAVGSTARGRRPINLAVNAARGAVATLEILSDGSILSVYDICLHKLTQTRSRLPASTSAPIIAQLRAQLFRVDEGLLVVSALVDAHFDADAVHVFEDEVTLPVLAERGHIADGVALAADSDGHVEFGAGHLPGQGAGFEIGFVGIGDEIHHRFADGHDF